MSILPIYLLFIKVYIKFDLTLVILAKTSSPILRESFSNSNFILSPFSINLLIKTSGISPKTISDSPFFIFLIFILIFEPIFNSDKLYSLDL